MGNNNRYSNIIWIASDNDVMGEWSYLKKEVREMIRAYFYSFFVWAFIYCFIRADWYVILGFIIYGIPSAIAWIKIIKETIDK